MGHGHDDKGRLETACAACHRYVSRHGEPRVLDGLSANQRLFVAYAEGWQGAAFGVKPSDAL